MGRRAYTSAPIFSIKLVKEKSVRFPLLQIGNSQIVTELLHAYLKDKPMENLVIVLMDGAMNFLGLVPITSGGISGIKVGIRDVLTPAIVHRASSIIIGHNHPSGDPSPSEQDMEFTKELVVAGKMMGCYIMDHIIVSSGINKASFSFHSHGLLSQPGDKPE